MYGLFSRQVECLSLQSVSLWSFQFEPVYDRLLQTLYDRLTWSGYVRHYDFVLPLLQPASWHVECLLWSYLPETANGISVDIHLSLAKLLHVDKCIGNLIQLEGCTVVATHTLIFFADRLVFHLSLRPIVIGQTEYLPVTKLYIYK